MKHLPLDSQIRHSAKGKSFVTSDCSIVPGQTFLTLDRGKKSERNIELIPHVEGKPWIIMRMNVMQQRKIIPSLAMLYPILYHPALLGYFFLQASLSEVYEKVFDCGLDAYCVCRRDSADLNGKGKQYLEPELLDYQMAISLVNLLSDPDSRFSTMAHTLDYYAEGHEKLIGVSGPLRGYEGYIIRKHRTRMLVFSFSESMTFGTESIRDSRFMPLAEYIKQTENKL